MVVIHVKGEQSEKQEFLYECPSYCSIDEITDAISEISTLQSTIQTLSLLLTNTILTHRLKENHPDVALRLERTISEADAYVSKDQVLFKRPLSPRILKDHIQAIEKEAKAAGLDTLPDSNSHQLFSFQEHNTSEYTQLWWAGKQLLKANKLSEYIGDNEKTKVLIKLKTACSGS